MNDKKLNSKWLGENIKTAPPTAMPSEPKFPTTDTKLKDIPNAPKRDTELSADDTKTLLKAYANEELLSLLVGQGWGIGKWVRLIIFLLILITITFL